LSASADYNVSIIENFAPPKQFVPGQTVKKEEAVVNTGSVDAFVKQTISGVLTVTVEVPTTKNPKDETDATEKAKYVKLSQKEFGALEAGSTLAWKPAADTKNKTGVVIGMGIDGKVNDDPNTTANEDNNAFVLDATGLYVFRRAVQKTDTTGEFKDVSYDYVAYYYDKDTGDYYKVYALKVDEQKIYKEGDTYAAGHERAGEKVSFLNAGELKAEPIYTWTKTVTTTANKQAMYYEGDGAGGKRLKVVYNGLGAVDATITGNAASSGKAEIYDAYNAYETKNLGETVYSEGTSGPYKSYTVWNTSDASAWVDGGDGNSTGLTTYDQYDQDKIYHDSDKQAHANLDNFGLDRLTHLQTETVGELNKAITKNAVGDADEDYWTLQESARTSRKTVNEGRDAAKDLASYLSDVYSAIGQAVPMTGNAATFTSAATKSGLFIVNTTASSAEQVADTFEWRAKMIYDGNSTSITVPTYNDANGEVGLNGASESAGFVKFKYGNTGNASQMGFATNSDTSWTDEQL